LTPATRRKPDPVGSSRSPDPKSPKSSPCTCTPLMHGTELLQMTWSTKQDMRSKLVMWLLQPAVFSWR